VKTPIESTSKRPAKQPVQEGDEATTQAVLLAERDRLLAENAALVAELNGVRLLNEKLKLQIARMKRVAFGSTSEKDKALLAQFEWALDDLETSEGQSEATPVPVPPVEGPVSEQGPEPKAKPARRPLPEHLPRESVERAPAMAHSAYGPCCCPSCGKQMRQMGEDDT
jgi:transposase